MGAEAYPAAVVVSKRLIVRHESVNWVVAKVIDLIAANAVSRLRRVYGGQRAEDVPSANQGY
jgi:hypothetical protein